uniref:Ig-like domain-containing protein n=1 Tax=Anabas testudineus TaxID=64144 RepID=A0A3Q1J487_ANATE
WMKQLHCQLMDSKDVLQVTWQKILPDHDKNMASYNKHYGQRVNSDFREVKFKDVGLKNCSIVIRNITEQDEGCYLCLFNCYPDGALTGRTCLQLYDVSLTSEVQTLQTVMAAVGEEAHFSCQLMDSKDVRQVTWQKILPDHDKNMAVYNKYFGQRVNSDFRDKVKFKDVGLKNCSIVMRNITEQDEGCYLCLFDCYPDGLHVSSSCVCKLWVDVMFVLTELHEPILHVRESNSPEESVVSCSVTGRPAPTVTLTVSQQHLNLSHYHTVTVNNTDATVTVNTTAVLSGFHGDSIQVGCAVRVLSGPQKEVFVMIPEVKATSADGEKHVQTS